MPPPVNSIDTHDSSLYSLQKRQLFLLLCVCTLLLLYIKKSMIENETAAFEFMADQPEGSILHLRSLLQYLSIPLIYAWKFTVLGFVVWVGCFMFGYRVTFSQCWQVVLVAEYVFLIPEVIKIFWFLFIDVNPNYYDIRAFYPLSVMNFFSYQDLDSRYAYPFKALNFFEILYMVAVAFGLKHFARRGWRPAWMIVIGFYLPLLLLWLVFYMIVS